MKELLTFLIEDEDDEIFGYYFNTQIVEKYHQFQITDSKSFHFNLQSNKNRLKHPMKFEKKDLEEGGIILWEKSDDYLICLGDIYLRKVDMKHYSYCNQNENYFDYHGISNALCGKSGYSEEDCFNPKRILVIQMK